MFRGRILDRYITRELLAPFFLSIAVLTLALFLQRMFRLVEFILSKGSSLAATGKLLLYIMPSFLVLTIPMSLLIASLTAFTRLSSDSEVTALKASRISLYEMIRPVLHVAIVLFLITTAIAHFVAPRANFAFKAQLFELVRNRAMVGLEQGIFSSTFDGMVVYVDQMNSLDDMTGIFISDERSAQEPYVITARQGQLSTDPDRFSVTLNMRQGTINLQPREEGTYTLMSFDTAALNLDINRGAIRGRSERTSIEETDSYELVQLARTARAEGQPSRPYEIELHKRLSISFACLVFGLVGAPLGIRRTRSGRSAGIAIAMGVILIYYLVLGTGANLAETQALSPAAAYWVPNLLVTLAALALVFKKGHEIYFGIYHRLDTVIRSAIAALKKRNKL
jgi:lipopolysaccharide export system permease protein